MGGSDTESAATSFRSARIWRRGGARVVGCSLQRNMLRQIYSFGRRMRVPAHAGRGPPAKFRRFEHRSDRAAIGLRSPPGAGAWERPLCTVTARSRPGHGPVTIRSRPGHGSGTPPPAEPLLGSSPSKGRIAPSPGPTAGAVAAAQRLHVTRTGDPDGRLGRVTRTGTRTGDPVGRLGRPSSSRSSRSRPAGRGARGREARTGAGSPARTGAETAAPAAIHVALATCIDLY